MSECSHEWEESNVVLDFSPEIYSRRCPLCGLVQQRFGLVNGEPHPSFSTAWEDLAEFRAGKPITYSAKAHPEQTWGGKKP